jgi:positive regulator of sigma E activity
MTQQPYDFLPLWTVYVITVLILFAGVEAGFWLSKRMRRRNPDRNDSEIGPISAATLALLAFILAFLVSYSVGIFNERRQLVITEANAIGTAYLRAGYLDQRLLFLDPAQLQVALARSEELQNKLWQRAEAVARLTPTPTISLYLASLNELIDTHTERVNIAFQLRVPSAIIFGVYIVAFFTMFLVGMQSSIAEYRNIIALVILVLILAVVFFLIIDLDRSQQGLLRVSQQALFDLQSQLPTLP